MTSQIIPQSDYFFNVDQGVEVSLETLKPPDLSSIPAVEARTDGILADSPEDQLLEKLICAEKLDGDYWLVPAAIRPLPPLDLDRIDLIRKNLSECMEFPLPSPLENLKISFLEILVFIEMQCKIKRIPCEMELVGTGASWFCGLVYYEMVLNELLEDSHTLVSQEMHRELTEMPADLDYRINLLGSSLEDPGILKSALIRHLMDFLPPTLFLEDREDLIRSRGSIFSELDEIIITNPETRTVDLHYCLLGFNNSSPPKKDLLLVHQMKRLVVFTAQDLRLPLTNLMKRGRNRLSILDRPIGDKAFGMQAIVDKLCKILHLENPHELNYKAWPVYISFITKKYKCSKSGDAGVLRDKVLAKCNGSINPVYQLLQKWQAKHLSADPGRFIAFSFNACQDFLGYADEHFIKSLWNETRKSFEVIHDRWKCLVIALDDPAIPFELVSAVIQLRGFLELSIPLQQQPHSITYYLVDHGSRPSMQVIIGDSCLLLPFDPTHALKTYIKYIRSFAADGNQGCETLIRNLFEGFSRTYNTANPVAASLDKYKNRFFIDYDGIENLAEELLPYGMAVAYRVWLSCYHLHPSLSLVKKLCRYAPEALVSELSNHLSYDLWSLLNLLLFLHAKDFPSIDFPAVNSLFPLQENRRVSVSKLIYDWAIALAGSKHEIFGPIALEIWHKKIRTFTEINPLKGLGSLLDHLLTYHPISGVSGLLILQNIRIFAFDQEQRLLIKCMNVLTCKEQHPLLASRVRLKEVTEAARIHLKKSKSRKLRKINSCLVTGYLRLLHDLLHKKESILAYALFKDMMTEELIQDEWKRPAVWSRCGVEFLNNPVLGLHTGIDVWKRGLKANIWNGKNPTLEEEKLRIALLEAMQNEGFKQFNEYMETFNTDWSVDKLKMRMNTVFIRCLQELERGAHGGAAPLLHTTVKILDKILTQKSLLTPQQQEEVKIRILQLTGKFARDAEIDSAKFLQILQLGNCYEELGMRESIGDSPLAIGITCLNAACRYGHGYPSELIVQSLFFALKLISSTKKPSPSAKESLYELSRLCTEIVRKFSQKANFLSQELKGNIAEHANHLIQALWIRKDGKSILRLVKFIDRCSLTVAFSKPSSNAIFQGIILLFQSEAPKSLEQFLKIKKIFEGIRQSEYISLTRLEEEKEIYISMAEYLTEVKSVPKQAEGNWIDCVASVFHDLALRQPSILLEYLRTGLINYALHSSWQKRTAAVALVAECCSLEPDDELIQQMISLWKSESPSLYLEDHPSIRKCNSKLLRVIFESDNPAFYSEGFIFLKDLFSTSVSVPIPDCYVKIAADGIQAALLVNPNSMCNDPLLTFAEAVHENIIRIMDSQPLILAFFRHKNPRFLQLTLCLIWEIMEQEITKTVKRDNLHSTFGSLFAEVIMASIIHPDEALFELGKNCLSHTAIPDFLPTKEQSPLYGHMILRLLKMASTKKKEDLVVYSLAFFKDAIERVQENSDIEWKCIEMAMENTIALYVDHDNILLSKTWECCIYDLYSQSNKPKDRVSMEPPYLKNITRRQFLIYSMYIKKLITFPVHTSTQKQTLDNLAFNKLVSLLSYRPKYHQELLSLMDEVIYNPTLTTVEEEELHEMFSLEFLKKASTKELLSRYDRKIVSYATFVAQPYTSDKKYKVNLIVQCMIEMLEFQAAQKSPYRFQRSLNLLSRLFCYEYALSESDMIKCFQAIFSGLLEFPFHYHEKGRAILEKVQRIFQDHSNILMPKEKNRWQNGRAGLWLDYVETIIRLNQMHTNEIFPPNLNPMENIPCLLKKGWLLDFHLDQNPATFKRYIQAIISLIPFLEVAWKLPKKKEDVLPCI
jgi:hypothetical protein